MHDFRVSVSCQAAWYFQECATPGSQISRLSSLGVVLLSEVLSPGIDLNSSIVCNVLRGWIAHGDVARVWVTQPLSLSTVSCILEACHRANVVGFFAEFNAGITCQPLVQCIDNKLQFQLVQMDMCAFGLPFKRRFLLVSVHVPMHMKLARRCDNHGNVCSFSGKTYRQPGSCFKGHFLHRAHLARFAGFIARTLVHSFHAKDSWAKKRCWLY